MCTVGFSLDLGDALSSQSYGGLPNSHGQLSATPWVGGFPLPSTGTHGRVLILCSTKWWGPCLFHHWTMTEPQASVCPMRESSTFEPQVIFIHCAQPVVIYLKVGGSGVPGHL